MATITQDVVKLGSALGAEIRGIDLSKPIDEATRRFIQQAWLDNLVVVFRDQNSGHSSSGCVRQHLRRTRADA